MYLRTIRSCTDFVLEYIIIVYILIMYYWIFTEEKAVMRNGKVDRRGEKRFRWELEKFIITRLRPSVEFPFLHHFSKLDDVSEDVEKRFWYMDKYWKWKEIRYKRGLGEFDNFPRLTNHEVCHEMFWNAVHGRSKMYIQIKDLRFDENIFSNETNGSEVITLQCSLLTLQMLDYDIMMFRAMSDEEDKEYREAAKRYYRPYLFGYVAEVDQNQYRELRQMQRGLLGMERESLLRENDSSPYVWMACTFNPDRNVPHISLDGYVVQSASSINKIRADLCIIEDEKVPVSTKKSILDGYELRDSCIKDDDTFIQKLGEELKNNLLSTVDIYKIGNGNCVFAQTAKENISFFYDIGFNYRHRPKKIMPGVSYTYSDSMKEIYAKDPSFFILSHWDLDHIAGGFAVKKAFLDKKWFAPDCYDAGTDAKRFAKYLDLKDCLFLAVRHPKNNTSPARMIGQININTTGGASPRQLAAYRFYMGRIAGCDSSYPNCEGIVIEYTDSIKEKTVLMMGDVNYSSFNMARSANKEVSFADTKIDYLIAPHHGSERTDHKKIIDNSGMIKKGTMAVICCTDDTKINRPNIDHLDELKKRFDDVYTTENPPVNKNSISIII